MKIIKTTVLVAVVMGLAFQAPALTWLGYFDGNGTGTFPTGQPANTVDGGGNDTENAVENALAFLGLNNEISLLGKSDNGLPINSDFTTTPNDLVPNILTGSISYVGSENIAYVTFKVGNVNNGTAPSNGYHLYAWDGGGSFNLMTDPNPDFTANGNTVSHYSVWTGNRVPDAGSTVALLGSGLLALGALRRRLAM